MHLVVRYFDRGEVGVFLKISIEGELDCPLVCLGREVAFGVLFRLGEKLTLKRDLNYLSDYWIRAAALAILPFCPLESLTVDIRKSNLSSLSILSVSGALYLLVGLEAEMRFFNKLLPSDYR